MAFSAAEGAGGLYRLDPDYSVHRMLENVTISNGICWSEDRKTMYFIDSLPGTVSAFDFDLASGGIHNRRTIIAVDRDMGLPDGMAIDEEGHLWIAHYGGSCVRCWDPDSGAVLETILIPTENVTACAFGGPELGTLYITTAGGNDPARLEAEPLAGCLFAARPGVRGHPTYRFAG
jgi:sugar lactone lactonase YvrE